MGGDRTEGTAILGEGSWIKLVLCLQLYQLFLANGERNFWADV
jgi:hypothetical protein